MTSDLSLQAFCLVSLAPRFVVLLLLLMLPILHQDVLSYLIVPPVCVDVTQWQSLILWIWIVPLSWESTGHSVDLNHRGHWKPACFGNCWARIVWAEWIIASFNYLLPSSKARSESLHLTTVVGCFPIQRYRHIHNRVWCALRVVHTCWHKVSLFIGWTWFIFLSHSLLPSFAVLFSPFFSSTGCHV